MHNFMKEKMSAFIGILCSMRISESTIHAITEMMWEKWSMMDKLVAYIKANPKATEQEIIRKATEIHQA